MRDFRIEIKTLEEMGKEFVSVWKNAEAGEVPEKPIERVYFENIYAVTRILTPKRLTALKTLHDNGPVSIRALAKLLKRDYKNVHQDIAVLSGIGLVDKNEEGLYTAPFDRIHLEIPLAA